MCLNFINPVGATRISVVGAGVGVWCRDWNKKNAGLFSNAWGLYLEKKTRFLKRKEIRMLGSAALVTERKGICKRDGRMGKTRL